LAIAAFIKLKRKYSALKLIIIGPDYGFRDESGGVFSIHEYLDMHCQNVEIRDSIEWTGQIPHDEVVKYRQRSFITIMCSRFDNFSNVVLEAMAHGCPLVASDSGGTPEMLEDNKSGLLFRSDSVDELVEKITILLEAPDLAQTMANKAYSSIRTRFNTKIITLKTYAYYENLLSAR
jgi:glycosyltransferase involved in cell wall biosynthesis